jgi:SAM-dependent methyltransferase
MRYYYELSPQTIHHVSPSVLMLDNELQQDIEVHKHAKTILDLGCGNGRNSLYLARKYGSTNVVLVDSDNSMLNWAQQLFCREGLPVRAVCIRIEELCAIDSSKSSELMGLRSFDIVIFSYIAQHIDPVYYPLIFDFCKHVSKEYLAIDVFWNPCRLGPSEYTRIGSVNWYGLTYEELVSLLASRFQILSEKVRQTNISFMVNMLLTEGKTLLKDIPNQSYEYGTNRIRHRSSANLRDITTRHKMKSIDIKELESTKLLSSLYPIEMDLVIIEISQWIESSNKLISPSLLAARFLYLCRINKVPVMLHEVSRDFRIRPKNIMHILSDTNYVPPLGISDYIFRICRQLGIPDNIRDYALSLLKEDTIIDNTTPTMKACCALIKAVKSDMFNMPRNKIASALGVSSVGKNGS